MLVTYNGLSPLLLAFFLPSDVAGWQGTAHAVLVTQIACCDLCRPPRWLVSSGFIDFSVYLLSSYMFLMRHFLVCRLHFENLSWSLDLILPRTWLPLGLGRPLLPAPSAPVLYPSGYHRALSRIWLSFHLTSSPPPFVCGSGYSSGFLFTL
ncbi:hypothetical protein BDY19DRAFT_602892 [Irpex rosettiformis]|uniref:Uncharacterized protein n=1 Tax=Irpex rosettiformis TaxID=378272 RepID=A0ACB8TQF2_9APHY|nr:hypothetical protein BDY19DRAFT_602892 [Irpex rosettiformis]